jgi:zinc transport system permease protein
MARQFTHDFKKIILLSVFFGIVFTQCGLWLSYLLDWPSGATIILVGGALFLISFFALQRLRHA